LPGTVVEQRAFEVVAVLAGQLRIRRVDRRVAILAMAGGADGVCLLLALGEVGCLRRQRQDSGKTRGEQRDERT